MIRNTPSLDLVEFIESKILPQYARFDKAHSMEHVTRVIRRSLDLVRLTGADIDMVYVVAAYHDLGLSGPRAIHHKTGGQILASDERLKKWFSPQQIQVMKEAVEDHRASASRSPRSIYGKIVAEADRDLEPDEVFRRTVEYGLDNYAHLSLEAHWERFVAHIMSKYSSQGYIRLWISGSQNEQNLKRLRSIIDDRDELRRAFIRHYVEATEARGSQAPATRASVEEVPGKSEPK